MIEGAGGGGLALPDGRAVVDWMQVPGEEARRYPHPGRRVRR